MSAEIVWEGAVSSDRVRVVRLGSGSYVAEILSGSDALGAQIWQPIRSAADDVALADSLRKIASPRHRSCKACGGRLDSRGRNRTGICRACCTLR